MKRTIANLYTLKQGEATGRTNELKRLLGLGASASGFSFSEAATTHIDITGDATTCIKTQTGTFGTGINLGGTLTTGITIGACDTALIVTGATTTALSVTGSTTTGLSITDATTGILLNYTASKTEGLSMTVATTKTVGTGMSLSGAGTYTTGILLDATATTTGISITAGSLTDGIKISATTPVDGVEVSSACSGSAFNVSGASVYGFKSSGAVTTSAIDITGVAGRAIRIGTKQTANTSVTISSGAGFEAEPANNYLLGLFAKVAQDETASDDELRGAWIRTRVNDGCHVGTGSAGYGFGVCGAEIQLKVYADSAATNIQTWQASAVWAQLETQGASTVTFEEGCVAQCLLANVGLTSTTVIDSGAVVAGLTVNSNTAGSGVTATGGFYGIYVYQDEATCLDFQVGLKIGDAAVTTGVSVGSCTTAFTTSAAVTTGFNVAGDATDAFKVTSGTVGTGFNVATAVTTGFSVGAATTTAYNVAGDATDAFKITSGTIGTGLNIASAVTTGISIAGATTTGISITGDATDAVKILTGTFTSGVNIAGTLTTGVTVGACTSVLAATGSATQVINVTAVAGVSNFIKFDSIAGCVQSNDVDPNDTPSEGGLGADGCIKIDIGGDDYFIPIFATEIS